MDIALAYKLSQQRAGACKVLTLLYIAHGRITNLRVLTGLRQPAVNGMAW